MEKKDSFVRYISHEIRSPLATTSLGLDFLLEKLKLNAIQYGEITAVVSDAKLTCDIATSTLNDMLMFDKIQKNMLEVFPTTCNAFDFVTQCVRPFLLQASVVGVELLCISDGCVVDATNDYQSNVFINIDEH